jgi:hypothetical protein
MLFAVQPPDIRPHAKRRRLGDESRQLAIEPRLEFIPQLFEISVVQGFDVQVEEFEEFVFFSEILVCSGEDESGVVEVDFAGFDRLGTSVE